MKKAAKVFLILGMVLTFYLIFPVVLGCITINKINDAKSTEELKKWGVLSIIFVSVLGGIFTLCIRDYELANYKVKLTSKTGYETEDDPSEKLVELKSLLDEGIIDEQTYQEKRKKYLEEL